MAYLEITDLKKSFGYTDVLNGISLTLNKGEVLSLIGSSGSGKTTLLRCINFLESPHEGKMTLDGEVLLDAAAKKMNTGVDTPAASPSIPSVRFTLFTTPTMKTKERI